jgi:hypothetical protein
MERGNYPIPLMLLNKTDLRRAYNGEYPVTADLKPISPRIGYLDTNKGIAAWLPCQPADPDSLNPCGVADRIGSRTEIRI